MNKEKEYNNKKYMIASIGTGAMIGNAAFGIWDQVNANLDCVTPVLVIGTLAALTTGIALLKKNPYKEVVAEEEEMVLEEEQSKVKKLKK